jgi:hypothetical protein
VQFSEKLKSKMLSLYALVNQIASNAVFARDEAGAALRWSADVEGVT